MHRPKIDTDCVRIDPEVRLCPEFDATSIKLFQASDPDKMGLRILDNCPEEHIQ